MKYLPICFAALLFLVGCGDTQKQSTGQTIRNALSVLAYLKRSGNDCIEVGSLVKQDQISGCISRNESTKRDDLLITAMIDGRLPDDNETTACFGSFLVMPDSEKLALVSMIVVCSSRGKMDVRNEEIWDVFADSVTILSEWVAKNGR
ncbi:hypothetical protein HY414_02335 [Candidatus Kaiserbacteria bacterium]|nr:hypothetical protein [Candidatus Kaiserbacteria bacterium]